MNSESDKYKIDFSIEKSTIDENDNFKVSNDDNTKSESK